MALGILDGQTRDAVTASYAVPDLETAVQQAVYNCIDANAKTVRLSVDIEHAAFTAVDDGDGIEPNDLYEYIGECYASSRLPVPKRGHSEQKQRKTYGSRGAFLVELRSLAMVVEIESRFHEHWTSYRKVFKNGDVVFNARSNGVREAPGTKVSVSNLFAKLPVRRKELSSNTKYRARVVQSIQNFCVSMSMIWPSISFDVRYEGGRHRPVIITGAASCHERLLQHFGPVLGYDLQYVEFSPDASPFSIRGYFAFIPTGWDGVGHGIKQAKSYYQFAFLGNEWVEECQQLCSRVLTEAALGVSATIPIFVLKVSAPRGHCDVSVIGKDGVQFKDPEQFSQFLVAFVHEMAGTNASHFKAPASNGSNPCDVLSNRSQKDDSALERPASSDGIDVNQTFNVELQGKLASHSSESRPCSPCYDLPVQEMPQLRSSGTTESKFWTEQDCCGSAGFDTCHACGHVNRASIIDSAEYQLMETREELNLSGSAQRLYEPAIFDSIPRRFASEESDASRAEADLAGIFFSKTSRQTLVERAERVDAAEGTSTTTPWLTSRPDAYDCTDDLLYLCQYDDCGDQSAPSLENDKREHDGQHNQVGRSSAAEEEDDFSDARQVLRIQGVAGSTSTYFDMNRIDRAASSLSKRWASINGASVKHFAAALNVENVRILNSGRAVKISRSMLANLQVLRQVDRKFILVQADTSQGKLLLCIDQHAADERVRLEELEADMFGPDGSLRNVETHGHEPPLRLRLNFKERETLQHYEELVSSWGFHFEWEPTHLEQTFLHELKHPETHEEVLLHTTPRVEKRVANADDFRDFIQLLSSAEGRYVHELIRPPAITRLLHSRACRSAIMFGHRLSFSQCTDLIEDLKKCQLPFQCAHGRPSVVPLAEIFSGGFSANS